MQRLLETNPNNGTNYDDVWRREAEAGRRQWDKYRYLAMTGGTGQPGHDRPLGGDWHGRYLDVCAGLSELPSWVANHNPMAEVWACDQSPWAMGYMAYWDPRVRWHVRTLTDLAARGLADRYQIGDGMLLADWTSCGETLEHLDDPGLAVRAVARVTRPGGTMVLTTPAVDIHDPWHVWLLDADDLRRLLAPVAAGPPDLRVVGPYLVARAVRAGAPA